MRQRRGEYTGVCETAILRTLQRGPYIGTVVALAALVGHPEVRTWRALVGLAGRQLVIAQRTPTGVRLEISRRGRAVGGR